MPTHRWPEDEGTGAYAPGEGDYDDAASIAQALYATGLRDYVSDGMGMELQPGPSLDIYAGLAVVSDSFAHATQSDEDRNFGVSYIQETENELGISLVNDSVHHVYLDIDLSSPDAYSFAVDTVDPPVSSSTPRLKVSEVDTNKTGSDAIQPVNRGADLNLDNVEAEYLKVLGDLDVVGRITEGASI